MTANNITIPLGSATLTVPVKTLVQSFLERYAEEARHAELSHRRNGSKVLPPIGAASAEHGGINCGRLIDENDEPYTLIVAPRAAGELVKVTWQEALDRVPRLDVDGFADWRLPNRMEALAMWQRLCPAVKDTDEAFAEDWYWTDAPFAYDPAYAWVQSFYYGHQYFTHRDYRCRARAVRRLAL